MKSGAGTIRRTQTAVSSTEARSSSIGASTPARRTLRMFSSMTAAWRGLDSTSHKAAAPRLAASSARAPEPAKRSSTQLPGNAPPMLSNSALRERPAVGRTPMPGGTFSSMLRALPAMICMTKLLVLVRIQGTLRPRCGSGQAEPHVPADYSHSMVPGGLLVIS